MTPRALVVQLGLFVVIAALCGAFVLNTLLGQQSMRPPIRVTVHMADAGGLAPTSDVTYRGVRVGAVERIRVGVDGVRLDLSIDGARRIPASSMAKVSMDTPMAIQHLDLQPPDGRPPYLRDGSVIEPERTSRPLPLESLLVKFMHLADSLDPRDVETVSEALATGLGGAEGDLSRILDNTEKLTELLEEKEPEINNLLDKGPELLDSIDAAGLPGLASSMRKLADQVKKQEPTLRGMLDTAPGVTANITTLLRDNQQAVSTLMGNLVTTAQIVSTRTPALSEAMYAVPNGISDLGSIAHGDTADFYLVVSQGPVCFYGTERRLPTDTSPREPQLGWSCAPGPNLAQRGADSAPRPSTPSPAPSPAPSEPASHEPFRIGSAGGQSSALGDRSWYSILLQGVR